MSGTSLSSVDRDVALTELWVELGSVLNDCADRNLDNTTNIWTKLKFPSIQHTA